MRQRDFSVKTYKILLSEFLSRGYSIQTFENYLRNDSNQKKTVILRHDVDKKAHNSYKTALVEKELGVKSSYYFRIVKESNDREVINEIVQLGHEIGYHYEDFATARGNFPAAIDSFRKNLTYFRKFYPVKTICMHGSPLSKWDNRDLWGKYNYREFGIIAEPYFDLDFNRIFYLTDTGRSWNAVAVSVRDKVNSRFKFDFRSTFDVINALRANTLPDSIMLNTHPQRWTDNLVGWALEYLSQNAKNIVKKHIVSKNSRLITKPVTPNC